MVIVLYVINMKSVDLGFIFKRTKFCTFLLGIACQETLQRLGQYGMLVLVSDVGVLAGLLYKLVFTVTILNSKGC